MQQENRAKLMGRGRARTSTISFDLVTKPTALTATKPKFDFNNNDIMGSFYEDQFKDSDQCKICDRNNAKVVCLHCGNEWKGRIRLQCQTHPKTVMLCDVICCPVCKADLDSLRELKG